MLGLDWLQMKYILNEPNDIDIYVDLRIVNFFFTTTQNRYTYYHLTYAMTLMLLGENLEQQFSLTYS